jgi:hypothetical protein
MTIYIINKMESKTYGKEMIIYYFAEKTFVMIVKGKVIQEKNYLGFISSWTKPSRLLVQPMTFKFRFVDFVSANDYNKDYFYRDIYDLVKDETKPEIYYKDDVYFQYIYNTKDYVKKYIDYVSEEERKNAKSKIVFLS